MTMMDKSMDLCNIFRTEMYSMVQINSKGALSCLVLCAPQVYLDHTVRHKSYFLMIFPMIYPCGWN